ncbi:MAG: MBL fold metallo-hydrolase [Candidatus Geothermincolia bacterium]
MSTDEVILIRNLIVNCYLVLGDPPFLVDTGSEKYWPVISTALADRGLAPQDLACALITHWHSDHSGNAAALAANGVEIWAPAAEAGILRGDEALPLPAGPSRAGRALRRMPAGLMRRYLSFKPVRVNRLLEEGDELSLMGGLRVIALPGHTRGGLGFVSEARKLAFTGDIVGNMRGKPGLPVLAFSEDREAILASMRRLADAGLEYMFPGHGAVLGPRASEILAEFLNRKGR